MPIYEYQCKKCHHQFEQLQKITDDALVICPKCGQNSLSKMVSQTSFQLKGTGWYVTDFKNQSKKEVSTPAAKKEVPATKPTETKTDTKTTAKVDTKTGDKHK